MHPDVPREGELSWIDWANECVWHQGEAVHLTPKVWAVLCVLAAQPGQVVPKAALLQAVWPDAVVSEAVLTECIRVLRQAFGETARAPHWIQTMHRRGYRFLGPVPEPVLDIRGALPAPGEWPATLPSALLPLGAPASAGPAPRVATLVGRAAELAQLHQRLAQAQSGTRQVVFVTGEPGLGKTTLVQAFMAEVAGMDGVWIASGQCLEHYGTGEAYLPVLEALGRVCRAPGGAALLTVLEHQAPMWLTQMPGLLSATALDAAQRWGLGATPARMVREMADALDTFTQVHALVLVLDDLHWSDVATLDLLSALAQRPGPARLLVLGTYRPVDVIVHAHPLKALTQALAIHGQCTDLPLELLTTAEVAQYLAVRCAAAEPLAAPFQTLAETLSQRTVGNPLFLVTMVDDLIRQGLVRQAAGQWVVEAGSVEALRGMPGSLRRMLTQQYDELPAPDQQMLDAASVAGMTWSAAVVAVGLEVAVEAVEARGAALVQRGQWLAAQGLESWPDGTVAECYRWQHTLYQEVVYERLPAGRRLRLHRCMGVRLAAGYGAHAGMQAAVLADHLVRGRDATRAVPYLQQAAENALQRHGYQEAIGHLTHGLALLITLPETPERTQQELVLQTTLAHAWRATKGMASPEVERAATRARELCQQVGETQQLFPVLLMLEAMYRLRAELGMARELAEQLLRLAQHMQEPVLLAEAHATLGTTVYSLGELVSARAHLEQAMAIYGSQAHGSHALRSLRGSWVSCLSYTAWLLWLLGYPDQALEQSQEALTLAQEQTHLYSLAHALLWTAGLRQFRRERAEAQARAEAAMILSTEQGFPDWLAIATMQRGWALTVQGHGEEGIARIHQGLGAMRAAGVELGRAHWLAILADAYGYVGRTQEGLSVLAEALATVHSHGGRWWEAELYRLKGELLLQSSVQGLASRVSTPDAGLQTRDAEAEACFRQALDITRPQQAKSLELRVAMSLSRLWQQQGKRAEARALLAPIYGWFTEGFDTVDLQEAKTLLDALA